MMTKIEKAKDLFLRGFRNDFIKKSTGFSTVDVRDMLRKECVPCSSADIVNYQVEYIKAHYSNEDVVSAYIDIIQNHVDPYHDGRLGRIFALDCCFGAYAKVVPAIIGLSEYKQLKVRCWKEKQISSVMVKYGVKNVFELPEFQLNPTAQNNHLNYLVFWDSRTHRVNGETISRLSDARGWFDAGCPDSFDYLKENTY